MILLDRNETEKFEWKENPVVCITVDVDWASEDALKYCLDILEEYSLKATFFLTHPSEILFRKIEKGYIDAGIHPNFMEGSSQGSNFIEVIEYCSELLPNAKCFRCHRYFDVNDINELLYERGFRYDSNLCTFLCKVEPFIHRSGLIRFPIYFEDGAYLLHNQDMNSQNVIYKLFYSPGLMIINIHPMHLVMNSPTFYYSRNIKDKLSRLEWNSLKSSDFEKISYDGLGMRDYILELFSFIIENNIKTYTLEELYNKITSNNTNEN